MDKPSCAWCHRVIRNIYADKTVFTTSQRWYCDAHHRRSHDAGHIYVPLWHSAYTVAVIIILILFLATCAHAQVVTAQGVLCDTEEQALEILTTHRYEGLDKAKLVYMRFNTERNESNEPRCAQGAYVVIIIKEVASLEDMTLPGIGAVEGFVYEVLTPSGTTFYLLLFRRMEKV